MSQKWFIAFRRVMAYFNFSFLAFKSSRFLVKVLSPELDTSFADHSIKIFFNYMQGILLLLEILLFFFC